MNRLLFAIFLLIVSSASIADVANYCGEVKRLRTWVNGGDTYGVWVEYKSNPSSCPGGFYLPHEGSNKDYVFSMALAAKASNDRVCVQIIVGEEKGNRCLINYLMHE